MNVIDLTQQRFGKLVVQYRSINNKNGQARWLCRCDCGTTVTVSSDHLRRKTGSVRSCGCLHRRRGADNPLWRGCGDITGNWWNTRILRERRHVKRCKVPVTITMKYAWKLYLKQDGLCALSGLPIIIRDSNEGTASLDRIDNSKGYIPGNVQWVHKDINFMKRNYSQQYFLEMCQAVSDYGEQGQ